MEYPAAEIQSLAERGVANNAEVGFAGESKTRGERRATGFLEIDKNLGGVVQPKSGIDGDQARRRFFVVRAQAVWAAVGGVEIGMSLEYMKFVWPVSQKRVLLKCGNMDCVLS